MDQVRLFIAVEIPAEVRSRLAEIEKRLMASGADVKWVPEGNFHITLKFLGGVDSSRVGDISSAVESAVSDASGFDAILAGVGAFPNTRRPSVVWVGITSGGDELSALAKRIEDAMEPLGFTREARAFSAHITVGRSRSPKNAAQLSEKLGQLRGEDVGSFRVDSVSVMKSDLRPTGPIYTKVAEVRLK